ncbi:hypothetical protein JCM10449v2_007590 [Rhodotorula kratochvilovae]
MLLVAETQGPTAQLGALCCRFFDPSTDTLVVNKLTGLELSTVTGDQVTFAADVPVFSSIAAVETVHLPGHDTASLIVLTTCLRLFVLTADPTAPVSAPRVLTGSSISIHEPFGRLAEYQDILVDPAHRCIVVHAYAGLVRIVPLPGAAAASSSRRGSRGVVNAESNGLDLSASYNVRLSTLNITSLAFVPSASSAHPVLAAAYASHTGHKVLTTYAVDLAEKELADGPLAEQVLADPGSELVVPLAGGVAVVGEESLTWYAMGEGDQEDNAKGKGRAVDGAGGATVRCRLPVSRVTAWAPLDPERILLGDLYGKLLLVSATLAGAGRVTNLAVQDLGDTTSPTSIVPLSPSTVYLSSRFGDSQLVRLPSTGAAADAMQDDEADGTNELALVESYASLAPILDFVLVGDSASSSSGYVVTCSGAYKTGSLRIVRRGVGLTELASLDVDGVQRVWAFASPAHSEGAQLLVVGFFAETRVFRLLSGDADGGEEDELDLEELDLPFFDAGSATLFAGALKGGLVVQATAAGVGYEGRRWAPEGGKKVTAAAARDDGENLVVAVEGGRLVVLRVEGGALVQIGETTFPNDVAALAVSASGSHAAVALWTSQDVHLVDLSSSPLAPCATHTIASTFLIRSLALTTFSSSGTAEEATLLAGLGNGTLVSLGVDLANGAFAPSASAKAVALGKRPLLLTEISHGAGQRAVFVASDRPTIVSKSKDRLVYSGVNLADTHAVAPLPSGLLALASPSALTLGRIGAIQQVDVRTVPLDEDEPRRIAHDAEGRCFVVACARRDVDRATGETSVQGVVRLLSEEFETVATLTLDAGEEAQSLTLARPSSGEALFLVGTTRAPSSPDAEPTEGRLLVLRASASEGTLDLLSATRIGGCPYALVPLAGAGAGHVASAVNAQVGVWSLADDGSLALSASWGGAFVAYALAAREDGTLLVGDALRSVTLLRFHPPQSAPMQGRLEELARDYRSRYMLGVAPLAGGEVLGAETDLNLFTLEREKGAEQGRLEDAGVLKPRGQWHLGQMVSRFRPGSLGQLLGDSSGVASPQLVYATSAGGIGVVAQLSEEAGRVLSGVERNLRGVLHGVGGLEQEEYRAFKSDKTTQQSAGFVDGSFVEQFLDLTPEEQEKVVAGQSEHERLDVGREEVGRLLEEVARVH